MFIGKLIAKFYAYKLLVAMLILAIAFDKSLLTYALLSFGFSFLILCGLMYEYHGHNPHEISNTDSVVLVVGVSAMEIVAMLFADGSGLNLQYLWLVKLLAIPVILLFNFILLAVAYSLSKRVFQAKDDYDSSYDD